jgi:hypothetical protein
MLQTQMLKCTLNETMRLLKVVMFSVQDEIFNRCHTLAVCTVISLLVTEWKTTVMYNNSGHLYIQLEVYIFSKLLFFF